MVTWVSFSTPASTAPPVAADVGPRDPGVQLVQVAATDPARLRLHAGQGKGLHLFDAVPLHLHDGVHHAVGTDPVLLAEDRDPAGPVGRCRGTVQRTAASSLRNGAKYSRAYATSSRRGPGW